MSTTPHSPAAPTASAALHEEALESLRALTGRADAQFHPGQFEAIRALVAERRRVLVVQRTGWGKSAVYFLSALLQRRRGAGPALIISPLIALMRDQVAAARRAGVRAEAISSANPTEWRDIVAELGSEVPVLATTATANSRVVADVAEQLGTGGADGEVLTLRGSLTRESLRLGSMSLADDRERLDYLVRHLDSFEGSGIIYALTVSAAEDLATLLDRPDRRVRAYTGRTDPEERAELEQALKDNEVKALAATSALGMGFDKPDLGFVIHLGAPSSPVAYYQQVGRAGRATERADVLLLPGKEDRAIWEYFATASMPTQESASQVLTALAEASGPLSTPALEARVDVRRSALELLLKVLAVDGAVQNVKGGWVSTGAPWHYDAERYQTVARARREEQQAMLAYEALTGGPEQCRMVFLAEQLDDTTAVPCGRCDVCAGPWYPAPDAPASAAAGQGGDDARVAALLERVGVPVEPRASWPSGLDRLLGAGAPKGRIPEGERAAEGRVIARMSDLGWAVPLRELLRSDENGNPVDAVVPERIGARIVEVLKDWDWDQRPAAVVAIPSTTRPQLVGSLAAGIASIGRLEDLGALDLAPGAGPLRGGGNSAFRVADLWEQIGRASCRERV